MVQVVAVIAALTASVPERPDMLSQAEMSVAGQSAPVDLHLVGIDHAHRGPSAVRNELAAGVRTGWLAPLDDDDLWHPHHVKTLLGHAEGADVVYSLADISGRPGWDPQQATFDADRLRQVNYIPLSGLIRAEMFHEVGGFPSESEAPDGYEDWGLWLRLLGAGARFVCVPEVTWTYRFGAWKGRSNQRWGRAS